MTVQQCPYCGYQTNSQKIFSIHLRRHRESQPDYDAMTVPQLQDIARDKGVDYAGIRKAQLIQRLKGDG